MQKRAPAAGQTERTYDRRMLRNPKVVLAASILLALGIAAAGAAKLLRLDFEIDAFTKYGLPTWLMIEVGITELAAAALLVRPRTSTLGAILGVAIMTVAIPTHLLHNELPAAPISLAFLAGFVYVGWSRRASLAALLR